MWSLLALVFVLVVTVTQSFPYRRQGGSIQYGPAPMSIHEVNRRGQDGRYINVYDDGYARDERTFHAGSRYGSRGGSILYRPAPMSFHEGYRRGQDGRYINVYDDGYARGERTFPARSRSGNRGRQIYVHGDGYARSERTFHARSRSGNRGNVIYESDNNGGHHLNAHSIGNLYKKRHTTTAAPTSTESIVSTDGGTTEPPITDEPVTPGPSPNGGNYHGNTGIDFNMGGPSITGPFTANGGGNVKVKVIDPRVNGPFLFNKFVTEEITTTDQPMTSPTTAEETTVAVETTTTTKTTTISFLVKLRKLVNDIYKANGGRAYSGFGYETLCLS